MSTNHISSVPLSLAFIMLVLTGSTVNSKAADFYEGKILTIVAAGSAGSSYDLYARLIAEYLPKYIPGHPTAVVQDMNGASGLSSAGYMYNVALHDGTVISAGTSNLPILPLLHPELAKVDATKYAWIGSATRDAFVGYVWHTAPVQTYEGAKQIPLVIGGLSVDSPSYDLPVISNTLFGTRFKIVTGYEAANTVKLAVERGEVQGSFGSNYSSVKSSLIDWIKNGTVKFIVQADYSKLPDLPDVPMLIDQAKTPEERDILRLELSPTDFNKPFYAPPGTPPDRVQLLRRAFDRATHDPAFVNAAEKSNLSVIDPMNGEELTNAVTKVSKTPPTVIERLKNILVSYRQN